MAPNPSIDAIYRSAERAAVLGVVINLALGVVKLLGGLAGRSFALIADAVNSLGDVFASAVVLLALHVARRPPDDEHPYGHTRAEAVAGVSVAMLIVFAALLVGWQAIGRMTLIHAVPPAWTLWLAGVNVLIKECLYRYNVRVGKRIDSTSLIANAWDHRSDAFCSLAVLVGLSIVRFGGPAWIGADEIAALVVVSAIIWTGICLYRKCASELMDLQAKPEFVAQVRSAANSVPQVVAVEKLWVRKSGLEYFADIHIEVDSGLAVAEGHRIGHDVKSRLMAEFPTVRDVLVHLEPHPHWH